MCRSCHYSTRVDRRRTAVVGPVVASFLGLSIVGKDQEMVVVVFVGTSVVVVDNLDAAFQNVVPVVVVASGTCRKGPALVGSSVSGTLVVQLDALGSLEDLLLAGVDYRPLPVLLHCRHFDVSRRQRHFCQHPLALLVVGHWVELLAFVGAGFSFHPCPVAEREASIRCLLLAVSSDHVRSSTVRRVVGTVVAATLRLPFFCSGYLL